VVVRSAGIPGLGQSCLLDLHPGTRLYESKAARKCDTVKLSGKALTEHSASQKRVQGSQKNHSESEYGVSAGESDGPEGSQSAEAVEVEAPEDRYS
jgi:hypothetical protein